MIFIPKPRIPNSLLLNKIIRSIAIVKNYKLDGSWELGELPFTTILNKEIYKMANLGTWTINTGGEYQEAESLLDVTFDTDSIYTIQPIDSKVFIRIGSTGKGFKITNNALFQFNVKQDDVVYLYTPFGDCEINIDESTPDTD